MAYINGEDVDFAADLDRELLETIFNSFGF